jgi:hypothetical protein
LANACKIVTMIPIATTTSTPHGDASPLSAIVNTSWSIVRPYG